MGVARCISDIRLHTFLNASESIWVATGDHLHLGLRLYPSTLGLSSTALRLPSAVNSSEIGWMKWWCMDAVQVYYTAK